MGANMKGLIRCPFCGEISKLYRDYARADVKADEKSIICDLWYVSCTKCGTKTKSFSSKIYMDNDGLVQIEKNGAELAIAAWNKRSE